MSKLPEKTKLPAIRKEAPSGLLDYLPAIYQEQFLGRYLSAFEKILLGRNDEQSPDEPHLNGLEETIDAIAGYFDPELTPTDFLPWLAGWVALSQRADLSEKTQRSFISRIIRLYRRRGTKENLIDLVTIFTGIAPTVDEYARPSEADKEMHRHLNDAHFFSVSLLLASPRPEEVNRQRAIASALIELEKPAHTHYELEINFAGLRLGEYADRKKGGYHATIGEDTFIGIIPEDIKQ